MSEILYQQRFVYAEITPYRDYCRLTDKPKTYNTNTFDVDSIQEKTTENDKSIQWYTGDSGVLFGNPAEIRRSDMLAIELDCREDLKRKNTKFFYSGEPVGIRIGVSTMLYSPTFYTTKDRQIKRHFNKPFSSLAIHIYERSIIRNGDRLIVKINHYMKTRFVNSKYFKKITTTSGFSINLKTGDIITFKGGKKNGAVKKNVMGDLMEVLSNYNLLKISNSINNLIPSQFKKIKYDFTIEFNDDAFLHHLAKAIDAPSTIYADPKQVVYKTIIDKFVNIKGIKTPNDYYDLITHWYPTKPFLKRNDNKLVASILDRLKIKSKQTIKLVHSIPQLDLVLLKKLTKYFGTGEDYPKYISAIDPDVFKSPKENASPVNGQMLSTYSSANFNDGINGRKQVGRVNNNNDDFVLTSKEKSVVVKLLNAALNPSTKDFRIGRKIDTMLRDLDDHFIMLKKLKQYFPDLGLTATTWESFTAEHSEISRLDRTVKRGYVIEYIFDENLVKYLEAPIKLTETIDEVEKEVEFYPVLLKEDTEYSEEGAHMHHCVASYANKEESIIISLRLEDRVSYERVTSEFDTSTKSCIQSRYFCNAVPPDYYKRALDILRQRVRVYMGSIKSLEKVNKPLIINGVMVGHNTHKATIEF
jgi:hypothetical protein